MCNCRQYCFGLVRPHQCSIAYISFVSWVYILQITMHPPQQWCSNKSELLRASQQNLWECMHIYSVLHVHTQFVLCMYYTGHSRNAMRLNDERAADFFKNYLLSNVSSDPVDHNQVIVSNLKLTTACRKRRHSKLHVHNRHYFAMFS